MNTQMQSITHPVANFIKQSMYALQVIVIALGIPILSYIEMTHSSKDDYSGSQVKTEITPAASFQTVTILSTK